MSHLTDFLHEVEDKARELEARLKKDTAGDAAALRSAYEHLVPELTALAQTITALVTKLESAGAPVTAASAQPQSPQQPPAGGA